jgi:putative SOS response-associated peptidase YedK
MCGRYTLSQAGDLPAVFEISETRIPPRFNIAPTQEVPVIRLSETNERSLDTLRWGLIPSWTRNPAKVPSLINARSETAGKKPAFRDAFRKRRCLVPADGFYEWKNLPGRKQPYLVRMSDRSLFAFAGIWESFHNELGQELQTFTILTCKPNDVVASIHDRMPVIMPRQDYSTWLDPVATDCDLRSLLVPYPSGQMAAYPVSRLVNSPRNDMPACMEAVDEPTTLFGDS